MAKDFATMKPRAVEAYLRERVREIFGDEIENKSLVWAVRGGYYNVHVKLDKDQNVAFSNFRKKDTPRVVKALRAFRVSAA